MRKKFFHKILVFLRRKKGQKVKKFLAQKLEYFVEKHMWKTPENPIFKLIRVWINLWICGNPELFLTEILCQKCVFLSNKLFKKYSFCATINSYNISYII